MTDFNMIMKKAQEMQAKLMAEQEKMAQKEITGTAGGGMVSVVVSGKNEVKRVTIDPSLIDPADVTVLEDLLVAATNDALRKVESEMSSGLSGILPPGMKLPF